MWPITTAYQVPRLSSETEQRWTHRCWFINKQNPKTHTEFLQAVKWSLIDASITYDQCEYSNEVTDFIQRMKVNLDKEF